VTFATLTGCSRIRAPKAIRIFQTEGLRGFERIWLRLLLRVCPCTDGLVAFGTCFSSLFFSIGCGMNSLPWMETIRFISWPFTVEGLQWWCFSGPWSLCCAWTTCVVIFPWGFVRSCAWLFAWPVKVGRSIPIMQLPDGPTNSTSVPCFLWSHRWNWKTTPWWTVHLIGIDPRHEWCLSLF